MKATLVSYLLLDQTQSSKGTLPWILFSLEGVGLHAGPRVLIWCVPSRGSYQSVWVDFV